MSYTYTRVVTDEEEAAIKYYVPDTIVDSIDGAGNPVKITVLGVQKELDFLIDTGIAHTLNSYRNIIAKEAEEVIAAKLSEYEVIKPTYDKIEALKAEEAKIVNDILDGKITASDITVAEVVKP